MRKYKSKREQALKLAAETNKEVVVGWPMFASMRSSPSLLSPDGKRRVVTKKMLSSLRSWVFIAKPDGTFVE